jgi:hypothetical protein
MNTPAVGKSEEKIEYAPAGNTAVIQAGQQVFG